MTQRELPGAEEHRSADSGSTRERAREALRVGDYDLVSRLLNQGEVDPDEVLETLRIYQAELEIQNAELRAAQTNAEDILRRFSAFFSSVPLAELVIDRNGLIIESNAESTRLFGTDTHHLRQHFLHRLVAADSRPALAGLIQSAHETGTAAIRSLGFRGAEGRDFQGEFHIARLPTEGNGDTQFVCAVVDLTERLLHEAEVRAAYRQLRDSEQRYRILAEYSPDWEYWLGDDGKYRYVSPACEHICGHSPLDFLADAGLMDRLVHPEDRPLWLAHFDRLNHSHQAEEPDPSIEFRILRPDGELRWIEHECRPVIDRDNRPLGRRGVNRDITARRAAEDQAAQLSRLYLTLSESNEAMVRARSLGEAFSEVVRIAVEPGGFRGCVVTLIEPVSGRPRVVAHHGLGADAAQTMPLPLDGETRMLPSTPALFGDRAHTCNDCEGADVDPAWREWAAAHGVRVCAHYPLHEMGQRIGALSLFGDTPDAFGPDTTRLFGEMALNLSYAFDHFAREQAVTKSENHLRSVLQTAPIGIGVVLDRHFVEVNPVMTQITGFTEAELVGQSTRMLYPDDAEFDLVGREKYRQIREHGSGSVETRWRRKDGEIRDILLSSSWLDPNRPQAGATFTAQDITARKNAENSLRLSEKRFRSLFEDVANVAVQGYDQNRRVIFWNHASENLYGFTREEAMGRQIEDLIMPEEMREAVQSLTPEQIAAGASIPQGELRLRRKDGSPITVFSNTVLRTINPNKVELFSLDVDLTRLREAEDALAQAAKAFENTIEGIAITDAEGRIQFVNRAFTEITGYSEVEILGRNHRILQSGRQDNAFYQAMWRELNDTGHWQGEIWNRRKNGDVYPEWLTITAVTSAAGSALRYVAVFSDITQLRRSEQERDFLANHDPLTELPNRLLLRDRLEHALERAERHGSMVAVLFMDLDRFKNVNEGLGHEAGDKLLRRAAKRILEVLRSDDTLARPGGDEFVIVLESDASLTGTTRVGARIHRALAKPFDLGAKPVFIGASIGVSWFPADGRSADTLLKNAELAMYQAKSEGGHVLRFFREQEAAGVLDRIELESDLRTALEQGGLLLHYQPQIELASGQLIGVEALLRWLHPERGLIPPAVFIPVAEESGLIGAVGDWVLMEACRQMMAWHGEGLAIPRMAVNLSVQQLERGALSHRVGEILQACALPAAELELEVTESMIMRHAERAIATLTELRDLGVAIAVDDFGTGYSSLAYLRRLPLHRLKIDRGFVKDIGVDTEGEAITRAIIGLGKSLGLDILAEGVETPEQAAFLEREGCEFAQGFLFSRPVPPKEITRDWRERIAPGTSGTAD